MLFRSPYTTLFRSIVVAAASGSGHWLAIVASVVVSTLLALSVTGLLLRGMKGEPTKDRDA